MKYAFLANPAVGHINPLMSIAKELLRKGNTVTFYLPGIKSAFFKKLLPSPTAAIEERLEKEGISFEIIPVSTEQAYRGLVIGRKRGLEEVLYALKLFIAGAPKYFKFLAKRFQTVKPDVIVYDYTFFTAIPLSLKLKIPRVAVYHSGLPFFEYPIPPIGSKLKYNQFSKKEFNTYFDLLKKEEEKVRVVLSSLSEIGINQKFLTGPSSDDLNLITSIEEAEYPRYNSLPNTYYVGPCYQNQLMDDRSLVFNKGEKKLIYISLGTVFNDQVSLYEKMISASIGSDVEIVVSAGKAFNKLKRRISHPRVKIYNSVPQLQILPSCDLFLTHGGKNSVNEALTFGVPMVLFPAGGEQLFNANLVEYLGFGISVEDAVNLSVEALKEKITFLINDSSVKQKLRDISLKIRSEEGCKKAARLIESKIQCHQIEVI